MSELPERRPGPPYLMVEEIREQPEAATRSLQLAEEHGAEIARQITTARRIYVTGCGTSFHAAQLGAFFLRSFTRGRLEVRAVEAFEFVTYEPGLRPDDLVIAVTHSGGTYQTLRALERTQRAGAASLAVTGFPESAASRLASNVLPTGYHGERSWAHTISYVAALTSLAAIANSVAEPEERLDLAPLPEVIREGLGLEEVVHHLAANLLLAEREGQTLHIVLTGAGPNATTALEGRLKLMETAYLTPNALELEEMLHGPLTSTTSQTVLIVIAPTGRSTGRARDLVRGAHTIGMTPVVLAGEGNASSFEEAHRLVLPDLPEVLSPIPYIVPLQLLAYFLAVGRGNNPDLLRQNDARYREAWTQTQPQAASGTS